MSPVLVMLAIKQVEQHLRKILDAITVLYFEVIEGCGFYGGGLVKTTIYKRNSLFRPKISKAHITLGFGN